MAGNDKEANMGKGANQSINRTPLGRLATALSVAILAAAVASLAGTSCGTVKTAGDTPSVAKTEDFVAGQIVVWFEDYLDEAEVDEYVAKTGGEVIEHSDVTPTRVVVSVPAGEEDRYVEAYRKLDKVRAADKNYVYQLQPPAGESAGGGGVNKIESQ